MDEDIKRELLEWLRQAREGTGTLSRFVRDQWPDFANEIVAVGRFNSIILVVMGVLGVILLIAAARLFVISVRRDDGEPLFACAAILLLFGVIGVSCSCTSLLDIPKPFLAPRLYVLEQVRDLIG